MRWRFPPKEATLFQLLCHTNNPPVSLAFTCFFKSFPLRGLYCTDIKLLLLINHRLASPEHNGHLNCRAFSYNSILVQIFAFQFSSPKKVAKKLSDILPQLLLQWKCNGKWERLLYMLSLYHHCTFISLKAYLCHHDSIVSLQALLMYLWQLTSGDTIEVLTEMQQ